MKKLFLLTLIMLPMVAIGADNKYKLVIDGTNESVYEDSLVKIEAEIWDDLEVLQLVIVNKSPTRMYIEWEGAKIYGSHVAFLTDTQADLNRQKHPEPVASGSVCVKMICKRYSSRMPIAKGSGDHFYLTIPMKIGDVFHDVDIKYIVE